MDRIAVFVDAGHLYAQGSRLLDGTTQPRSRVVIDEKAAVDQLTELAESLRGKDSLLRVYWYDGILPSGETAEQSRIAAAENVKLRFGVINSFGQQKGVDSLIVTDLIELARNRAISDALVLAGDDDLRVGVQVAQSFGVRVHLLGIAPARSSQSKNLLREADTTLEWDATVVSQFMTIKGPPTVVAAAASAPVALAKDSTPDVLLSTTIEEYVAEITAPEYTGILTLWASTKSVPREYDGRLLARCRAAVDRELTASEKKNARHLFISQIEEAALTPSTSGD